MKFRRPNDPAGYVFEPAGSTKVKFTATGNIARIQYLSYRPDDCPIVVLPEFQYCIKSTGEVKDRKKNAETRADNITYVRRAMSRGRDYINVNVTDINRTIWVTFTYAENMTDRKKLMTDWRNFNYFYRQKVGNYEYIVCAEPQARGAWHLHVFMIFEEMPYIDYNIIRETWGHGRVEVQHMYGDVDNLGAYLSAYLGNVNLQEIATSAGNYHDLNIVTRLQHDGTEKSFVKGMRLSMYPKGMRIFRVSKGIKKPESELIRLDEAEKKVSSAKLTFSKVCEINDKEHDYTNLVYTEYYNLKNKDCQQAE